MNPYASQLGKQDPQEVIANTPGRLEELVETLGDARVEQSPAPGKWSTREIICHLADCEVVFSFRLRQAIAEDHHVIQPFDQDKWAKAYSAYGVHDALDVFSSLRKWNLLFIGTVKPEQFSKRLTHPERGEMPFQELVETMAGHDINHVRQLEAIAARPASAR
jgi:DinB superfamily